MKRLFVGIPLSSDLRSKIEPLLTELKLLGISTVAVENLHLTVKFLGEVKEEELPEIKEKLTKLASLTPSFRVELKGISAFSDFKQLRVVWVGAESKELVRLMRTTNRKLDNIRKNEYPKEVPHLTLARIKKIENSSNFNIFMAKFKTFSFGVQEVRKIYIFEAKSTPKGPIYRVLMEIKLKTSRFG